MTTDECREGQEPASSIHGLPATASGAWLEVPRLDRSDVPPHVRIIQRLVTNEQESGVEAKLGVLNCFHAGY